MTSCETIRRELGSQYSECSLMLEDHFGHLFQATKQVGDQSSKVLVRKLSRPITKEQLDEVKAKASADDYLTSFEMVSSNIIVTDVDGHICLGELNKTADFKRQLCLEEFEAVGIAYRVNSILMQAEKDELFTFNVGPVFIYLKPIEGVKMSDRKTTHTLKLAEPYLSILYTTVGDLRDQDPYVPKDFPQKKENALAWSMGMLLYMLAFGEVYDNENRSNNNLSYLYTKIMFELLIANPTDRAPLATCDRKMRMIANFDKLIIYPTVEVQNLLTIRGIYNGQMRYGLMHGHGSFMQTAPFGLPSEMLTYEGYFCMDRMHVSGYITYRSNDYYKGEIAWDQPKGHGVLYKASRLVTLKGVFNGMVLVDDQEGELVYADQSVYKGLLQNNQPQGYGILQYSDGSVYTGNFDKGDRSGHGKLLREVDGVVMHLYEGQWYENVFHGEGEEKVSGEYHYKGSYHMGSRHGNGKFEDLKNGTTYEGEFKNDKFSGLGQLIHNDGSSYRGEFKAGVKEGFGVQEYPDGSSYDGQWANNKRHGEGLFIDANGEPSQAIYLDDEPVG